MSSEAVILNSRNLFKRLTLSKLDIFDRNLNLIYTLATFPDADYGITRENVFRLPLGPMIASKITRILA